MAGHAFSIFPTLLSQLCVASAASLGSRLLWLLEQAKLLSNSGISYTLIFLPGELFRPCSAWIATTHFQVW